MDDVEFVSCIHCDKLFLGYQDEAPWLVVERAEAAGWWFQEGWGWHCSECAPACRN